MQLADDFLLISEAVDQGHRADSALALRRDLDQFRSMNLCGSEEDQQGLNNFSHNNRPRCSIRASSPG